MKSSQVEINTRKRSFQHTLPLLLLSNTNLLPLLLVSNTNRLLLLSNTNYRYPYGISRNCSSFYSNQLETQFCNSTLSIHQEYYHNLDCCLLKVLLFIISSKLQPTQIVFQMKSSQVEIITTETTVEFSQHRLCWNQSK